MTTPSYWNDSGKHSATLLKEIRASNEFRTAEGGPALHKYLRAAFAYYQAMNNGVYTTFYAVFGVTAKQYADSYELVDLAVRTNSSFANDSDTFPTFRKVEAKLDALIEAAHEEIYG